MPIPRNQNILGINTFIQPDPRIIKIVIKIVSYKIMITKRVLVL